MEKQAITIITGATACGKTETSIELAKKIGGEIISADSMQVYKYMDIGTAKITKEEMQGVRHHLIDNLYPDDEYSVATFAELATKIIDDIIARGKKPIIVGGTGFYINALLFGNDFGEGEKDEEIRKELYELAEKNGNEFVHNMLREVDEKAAELIHFNNLKRVIRAIEFQRVSGIKISVHNEREKKREQVYNSKLIILNRDREIIYDRINLRVEKMIENGLLEEVKNLLKLGYDENLVSMGGIGYKEIVPLIKGKIGLEEAKETLKLNTRHFAKRQLTWFRQQLSGNWLELGDFSAGELADKIIEMD